MAEETTKNFGRSCYTCGRLLQDVGVFLPLSTRLEKIFDGLVIDTN